ncbi:MAG: WD40 repeat domain-containing protein, partial [Deltaproteobacteria bacterium]|nr:WD40 repeat domain-containing protein [Deltaproteobacteria bacterium]
MRGLLSFAICLSVIVSSFAIVNAVSIRDVEDVQVKVEVNPKSPAETDLHLVYTREYTDDVKTTDWMNYSGHRYLAVGTNNQRIEVYKYDISAEMLVMLDMQVMLTDVNCVDWLLVGGEIYLAAGCDDDLGGEDIFVYQFDPIGNILTLVDNEYNDNDVYSVDWLIFNGASYLAVGSDYGFDELKVYIFNNVTKSLILVDINNMIGDIYSVNWHIIDGEAYLAAGGSSTTREITVFKFESEQLITMDNYDFFGSVYSVNWQIIDGQAYLAAGVATNPMDEILVFKFDSITGSLLLMASWNDGDDIRTVAWLEREGRYFLATGGDYGTRELQIFEYDNTTAVLSLINMRDRGDRARTCSWSHDGEYLAVGGDAPSGPELELYKFVFETSTTVTLTQKWNLISFPLMNPKINGTQIFKAEDIYNEINCGELAIWDAATQA